MYHGVRSRTECFVWPNRSISVLGDPFIWRNLEVWAIFSAGRFLYERSLPCGHMSNLWGSPVWQYYHLSRGVRGGYLNIIPTRRWGFPFHIRSIYVFVWVWDALLATTTFCNRHFPPVDQIPTLYHNLKRFKGLGKLIRYSSPGNVIKMTIHKILGEPGWWRAKITQFGFNPTHPFTQVLNLLDLLDLPLSQENQNNWMV